MFCALQAELLPELLTSKAEKGVDFLFLAVVNIVVIRSNLLMCDAPEVALAKLAFGGVLTSVGVMDLGCRVSRKKEFVPPLTGCIGDYVPAAGNGQRTQSAADLAALTQQATEPTTLVVDPQDPHARIMRVPSGCFSEEKCEVEDVDEDGAPIEF